MAVVKKQIAELNEYLQIRQRLERSGIKLPPFNLHMMFLGNPGVGKTTIARIIAKVLFDLGYIREEKLVEVTSKDLVSTHGNTTGAKTNKVIMNAMGEFYSLMKLIHLLFLVVLLVLKLLLTLLRQWKIIRGIW